MSIRYLQESHQALNKKLYELPGTCFPGIYPWTPKTPWKNEGLKPSQNMGEITPKNLERFWVPMGNNPLVLGPHSKFLHFAWTSD